VSGSFLIKGFPEKIYLSENIGGKYSIVDSSIIQQSGDFSFKSDYKCGYYSLSLNTQNWAQLIINKEDVHLLFNDTILKSGIQIVNSKENQLLWSFIAERKDFKSQISQAYINKTRFKESSREYLSYQAIEELLTQNYNQYILELSKKDPTSFFARTIVADVDVNSKSEFFRYTDFGDSDLIRSGVITKKITDYLQFQTAYTEDGFIESIDRILILASKDALVYEFVLNYLLELFNATGPDIVLDYLIENYVIGEACTNMEYQLVLQHKLDAYKKLQVGNPAPNISTYNNHGIVQNLRDICSISRLSILYFGSGHCGFCNEITPELQEILRTYSNNVLQCIYFSLDSDYEEWIRSQRDVPINWLSLSELKGWDSKSAHIFQVHKTPTFYILDQESIIISKPKTMDDLKKEIKILTQKKAR
jgi:thioredoxin-related protein